MIMDLDDAQDLDDAHIMLHPHAISQEQHLGSSSSSSLPVRDSMWMQHNRIKSVLTKAGGRNIVVCHSTKLKQGYP